MIQQGLVESVHDCADGGLAVALAEKAFPKGVGARVNLASGGLFARVCAVWGGCQPDRDLLRPGAAWRESKKWRRSTAWRRR